ncbi:hypothetical protein U8V72_15150 [Priestia filamentosa]|uniref:hypothetical protein n=1 Tax=Priestia filamentosa TaxID=1402861 RepID=UPI0005895C84
MNGKEFVKPNAEQVAWVLKNVREHFNEGGTSRYLIYERLGFKGSEFQTLSQDGLALSQMAEEFRDYEKVMSLLIESRKNGNDLSQQELEEVLNSIKDEV